VGETDDQEKKDTDLELKQEPKKKHEEESKEDEPKVDEPKEDESNFKAEDEEKGSI
jgi:hypothetical protein